MKEHDKHRAFWEDIGEHDPYFGVLTHDEFRSTQINADAKAKFYESGVEHIDRVLRKLEKHWPKASSKLRTAVDFGCGTGRLSLALARHFEAVQGFDISATMLAEAEVQRHKMKLDNVAFQQIEGDQPFLESSYDYLHSSMVFQHIPPANGMLLLRHLLTHLRKNGLAFLQITHHTRMAGFKKQSNQFVRLFHWRKRRKQRDAYAFAMYDYDLDAIFQLFQELGVREVLTGFGKSGNHEYVRFYLRK